MNPWESTNTLFKKECECDNTGFWLGYDGISYNYGLDLN